MYKISNKKFWSKASVYKAFGIYKELVRKVTVLYEMYFSRAVEETLRRQREIGMSYSGDVKERFSKKTVSTLAWCRCID